MITLKTEPEAVEFVEGQEGSFLIAAQFPEMVGDIFPTRVEILSAPEGVTSETAPGGIKVTWTPDHFVVRGGEAAVQLSLRVRVTAGEGRSQVVKEDSVLLWVRPDWAQIPVIQSLTFSSKMIEEGKNTSIVLTVLDPSGFEPGLVFNLSSSYGWGVAMNLSTMWIISRLRWQRKKGSGTFGPFMSPCEHLWGTW